MVTRLRLGIKPPRRAIGAIAEEIKPSERRRTAAALVLLIREKLQDETRNFVEIGKMLNEARDSPELAGRWLAWLAEHFDMSDRTARNYMLAAEFVDKHRLGSETVSNLSRRLLYKMARREPIDDNDPTLTIGDWTDAIIKQILAEAARKRVDVPRAAAIADELLDRRRESEEHEAEASEPPSPTVEQRRVCRPSRVPELRAVPRCASIVPPPIGDVERGLARAMDMLQGLMTRPVAEFRETEIPAETLRAGGAFLNRVADVVDERVSLHD